MKLYKNDATLRELYEMSNDPSVSVSSTTLGAEQGEIQRVIKRAVAWKGIDGKGAFSGDAEAKQRLKSAMSANQIKALEKLTKISKDLTGTYGTVNVEYPDGKIRKMSKKNWKTIEAAGNPWGYKLVSYVKKQPSKKYMPKSKLAVTA